MSEVDKCLSLAYEIRREFDLSKFETYSNMIKSLAKSLFKDTSEVVIKSNSLEILNLSLDKDKQDFGIGKYHLGYVQTWEEKGKYEYYIQRSIHLLEAIKYNL